MSSARDPYLDEGMIGFIENFARKNHWRVASWLDLDDLVHEGWLAFYKIRRHPDYRLLFSKTRPSKDDVRQAMALVRTTLYRRMNSLASSLNAVQESSLPDGTSLDSVAPSGEDWGAVLATAPRELLELAAAIVDDAMRASRFARGPRGRETSERHSRRLRSSSDFRRRRTTARGRGLRETTNELYCRLVGLDPRTHDLRKVVREYLAGA